MKCQFFNPPVHHYAGVWYNMNPPLGLPILASVLEMAGHKAQVTDLEALRVTPPQLARAFEKQWGEWPDVVGFTVTTLNRQGVRECIEALRGVHYGRKIVCGGPHATLNPQEVLGFGADLVVTGECEGNIVSLLETGATGVQAGEAMAIEQIPGPLWAHHTPEPVKYYGNLPKVGHPEGISMWSRGCPHRCLFCGNPCFGHQKLRLRPVENIALDMLALKSLGVQSVFVYDDELVGHGAKQHDWLKQVCDAIRPLGLTWKCQGRCTTKLDRETMDAMYSAGCRAIMWGVESFSDNVLEAIHKDTTEQDIWHTLQLAHDAGIGNWLFLMVGNYKETAADLAHTERALRKAVDSGLVQWRQVTVTTAVPGTELYDLAKAEGWLVEPPMEGPQMNQVYAPTPWLSEREIRYWKARLESIN